MPVQTTIATYADAVEQAKTIRDAVIGEFAIKKNASRYLSHPSPRDLNSPDKQVRDDAIQRYADYVKYAVWTGVTGSTHSGYMGALFRKEPEIEVPNQIAYIKKSVDGASKSAETFAKYACSELLQAGLFGILVDYPDAPSNSITVAQKTALGLRPRALAYPLESIINWQAETVGGVDVVTLVVLKEVSTKNYELDEFAHETKTQYRVLRLRNEGYTQQLYDDAENTVSEERLILAAGRPLRSIPFIFVGSERNEPRHQTPPLSDIASLNIAHYRNSADYEESMRTSGNPTLFLTSDMSWQQFADANPDGISLGSRRGHFLGANGDAKLLQMTEVSALERAMAEKIESMQRLGAKLATQGGGVETAEAARIRAAAETSVLSTIAGNVSDAMTLALGYMAMFEGVAVDENDIEFSVNREFFPVTFDAQEMTAMAGMVKDNILPASIVFGRLRQSGQIPATITDDEIYQELGDEAGQQLTQESIDTNNNVA